MSKDILIMAVAIAAGVLVGNIIASSVNNALGNAGLL